MARKFPNWIEAFLQHTSKVKSPEIYRRWAAASAIASSLQRRAWVRIQDQLTYPNLYVLLIGPPGIGKSNAIKFARDVVRKLQYIRLTPTRITAAAFYLELEGAKSRTVNPAKNDYDAFHALTAMIDEFSVFVRPNNQEFMADLADVFDCPDPFEAKTKHAGESIFPNSWFNMIGGATPRYLSEAWSNTVLDQGFPSRCILVYSDEETERKLFGVDDEQEELIKSARIRELASDLADIGTLRGPFTWDKEARARMEAWYDGGMEPKPLDPRLEHYCQRRHVHVVKLATVHSAAKRSDQEIILEDLEDALQMLTQAEDQMHRALASMTANPVRDQLILAKNLISSQYAKTGQPVPERKLRNLLLNEVDPFRIKTIIEEMLRAGWIGLSGDELPEGYRSFVPRKSDG